MKIRLDKFKLKQDLDRINLLHYGHLGCAIFTILLEMIHGYIGLSAPFLVLAIFFLYRMYFKTLRELYYTFWTFSVIMALYFLLGIKQGVYDYELTSVTYINILGLIFLGIECYILLSPIYFPRVRWWEYDFRYRSDLNIEVKVGDSNFEGRLTDIRRSAGCVVMFEDLNVGELVEVKVPEELRTIHLNGEVMSKRENSIGRGITYGVKFHFDDKDSKNDFFEFSQYWKDEGKVKAKNKFKELD